MVIILQYVGVSNQHFINLKLTQHYIWIISHKAEKIHQIIKIDKCLYVWIIIINSYLNPNFPKQSKQTKLSNKNLLLPVSVSLAFRLVLFWKCLCPSVLLGLHLNAEEFFKSFCFSSCQVFTRFCTVDAYSTWLLVVKQNPNTDILRTAMG